MNDLHLPVSTRTGGIDASIQLYDSDIKKIMEGPLEWFNSRTGSLRLIDDVHKELVDRFHRIGYLVDVQVWTMGECRCRPACIDAEACRNLVPMVGTYQFQVMITGRVDPESGFDYDRMKHEIRANLLDIPGEGGTIAFDEKEFLRKHGGGKPGHRH